MEDRKIDRVTSDMLDNPFAYSHKFVTIILDLLNLLCVQ